MPTEAADQCTDDGGAPDGVDQADRGSILPFTAVMVAALIACAGLAVDGGRILGARREASALAAAAARRGSQELAWADLADGHAAIDPVRATAVAQAFLAQAGASGSVAASAQQVSVTVTITESTVVLGAFGIGSKTVTATRSAAPLGEVETMTSPGSSRNAGDVVRGLGALAALVTLVIGVPIGLIVLVGWPLPTALPSSDAVADALARTGISDRTVVKIVACVLWVAWLQVAAGIVAEVVGLLRRRDLRVVPVCGPLRRLTAALVASITVLVTTANAAPLPPLRAMAVAAAAPAGVTPSMFVIGEPLLAAITPEPGPIWRVQPRDTLWGIAEQTLGRGERWAEIRRANVGRSVAPGVVFTEHTEVLRPGWVLELPSDATVDAPLTDQTAAPPSELAPPSPTGSDPVDRVVVVMAGDTLSGLAERSLGDPDRWPELWEANRERDFDGREFVDPNLILPGWTLIVPGAVPARAPAGPLPAPTPAAEPEVAAPPPPVAPTEPSPVTTPAPPLWEPPIDVSRSTLPPPVADAVDVAAVTDSVTERPAWVLPVGITGAALLATGAAGLAASRRRRRLRSMGVDHALALADPDLALTAAALCLGDDPVGMARVDVALRYLAAQLAPANGSPTPRPEVVRRRRSGEIEVILDHRPGAIPALWSAGPDDRSFVLAAAVPVGLLVAGAGHAPSPCPGLVLLGLSDDAELYVDLEALGLVTLEGPPATVAAIARAVVATLAVSPLADLVHIVTSGVDCYGFANEERVQSVSDPDAALDLTAALSAGVRQALGDGGTHDLRRLAPEEPWEPVVAILLQAELSSAQLAEVCRLVASGGVAVVTDAEVPGARYRLRTDGLGGWQLDPLGLSVMPHGLAATELADLGALLADAKAPPVELPARVEELTDAPFVEPPWELLVRLLGPVEVVNRLGTPAPFERAKALELVAWLAQHRARSTRTGARTAMWESDVRDATFANVVSDARRALASLAVAPEGHEWLGRTYGDHLPLHPLVVTDAELLSARLDHARRQAPVAAVATLRAGLAGVHDAPYAGTAWLWPDGAGLPSNLTLLVTNAASLMAGRCLELGDHDGVFWATEQGMKVLPGHDELVCLRMHAHAAAGNLAGIRQEFESYERVVTADVWGDGSLSTKVVALRNRLLAPSRAVDQR